MKRAYFDVTVAGTNISAAISPILIGLTVTDHAGTHSDTATIDLDDTGGRIVLPTSGAAVSITLGWRNGGAREVFRGTVDEIRSSGSKSGGRTLSIRAKGVDTTGKAKEGQTRHFDGLSVTDILKRAGEYAGVSEISVDPNLASIVMPYLDMRAESFIHMGERLAALIGGSFRVTGTKATMARRAAAYPTTVTATSGDNLISWDITPIIGRARYAKARARHYDPAQAKEVVTEADTGLDDATAVLDRRDRLADGDEAERVTSGDAATSVEGSGGGSVVIDGDVGAVPDARCVLSGARPGIDGVYTIKTVTHNFTRSGGWTTSLDLAHPQDGAGSDTRTGAAATAMTADQQAGIATGPQ